MSVKNLQTLLDESGDIVTLLRNQQSGPNVYPGAGCDDLFPEDISHLFYHYGGIYPAKTFFAGAYP